MLQRSWTDAMISIIVSALAIFFLVVAIEADLPIVAIPLGAFIVAGLGAGLQDVCNKEEDE